MKITFRKVSKQSVLERMMKNKLQIGELSVPDRAVNEPSQSFHNPVWIQRRPIYNVRVTRAFTLLKSD